MPETGAVPLQVRWHRQSPWGEAPEAKVWQRPSPAHSQAIASPPSASPGSQSRRQTAVETLNKMFTGREQPLPRPSLDEESAEEIHTGWLVLIVLLIVVTAFGAGFMIVRPFLSTNR